ncbi:MAG: rhomboid family intramembrane serine protease [Alphaproteobacteria bacterium]|nr:rhomboid family intramembrane serine protease [Alphaproteobacteria bacterium]
MIPISDDNPVRRPAVMTWLIIIACALVYAWEFSLGRGMNAALDLLGFVPAALTQAGPAPSAVLGVPAGLTILISMFLHGSILHLAGNMLYLWIFGNNIEDAFGHIRFTLFYLLSGVAAAFSMVLVDPGSHVPMVGASGAISGVLAAYILVFPRVRVTVIIPLGIIFWPFRVSAIWVVGLWFATQLFAAAVSNPDAPGVAWWAHVGGFGAGLLLTPLFKPAKVPWFGPKIRRGPWN